MKTQRVLLCAGLLIATGVASRSVVTPASVGIDIARVPYRLAAWQGSEIQLSPSELDQMSADGYINRLYTAGASSVGVYAAYFARQRTGSSWHSPLNCLPGTGWEPTEVGTLDVAQTDGTVRRLRRLIVRKESDEMLVLYWYQI